MRWRSRLAQACLVLLKLVFMILFLLASAAIGLVMMPYSSYLTYRYRRRTERRRSNSQPPDGHPASRTS